MVNKADYIQWRDGEVTKQLFKDATEAIETSAAELLARELPNIDRDTFLRGYIKGLGEILTWRPEFPEEESNED